jgi:hypothetical protein
MDEIPEPLRATLSQALALEVKDRLSAAELRSKLRGRSSGSAAVKVAPPKLQVLSRHVVYDPEKEETSEIVVANTGGLELQGTATCAQPWVTVKSKWACAPGQTLQLPLEIDVAGLEPGETHLAQVKLRPAGKSAETTIRVEVRVPAPILSIAPMQVDLGRVSRNKMFTPPATFRVRNIGKSRAVCRIAAAAPWLVLNPTQFTCLPGGTQTVELTGRTDRLPRGEAHETTLQLDVQGGYSRKVQVSLQTRDVRRRVGSVLMVGLALSVLAGAIIWFIVSVLPSLLALL